MSTVKNNPLALFQKREEMKGHIADLTDNTSLAHQSYFYGGKISAQCTKERPPRKKAGLLSLCAFSTAGHSWFLLCLYSTNQSSASFRLLLFRKDDFFRCTSDGISINLGGELLYDASGRAVARIFCVCVCLCGAAASQKTTTKMICNCIP